MKKVFFIFRDHKSHMLSARLGVDCFCIIEDNNPNPIFQILLATVFNLLEAQGDYEKALVLQDSAIAIKR